MAKLIHEERYGVIVLLDALGVKGIWKNQDPQKILDSWNGVIDNVNLDVKEAKKLGMTLEFDAFSDTLIISITGGEIDAMIKRMAFSLYTLIPFAITQGINFRGCMSLGKFYKSENMIIGPAIDEAAMYYEKSDWIGVFATPSVYSRIKKNYSNFIDHLIEYNIPTKNKVIKSYAVTLFNDFKYSNQEHVKKWKSMINYCHNKLENTDDPVGSEKWKNTLEFLYYVEKNKSKLN